MDTDVRALLDTWGFLLAGLAGLAFTALAGEPPLYLALFALLAAAGAAALAARERAAGFLFSATGLTALVLAATLALDGGSLLLGAELALLGLVGLVGGATRVRTTD